MATVAPQLILMPSAALSAIGVSSVPKLLLTSIEAADALGISQRTLHDLTAPRGPLRAVRLGDRTLRYAIESLREDISRLQEQQNASAGEGVE